MTTVAHPPIPAPVIAYAARPASKAGRFAVHYATFLAVLFGLNALVSGLLLFVVPRFMEIFKDFRATLPVITQWLFSFVRFFDDNWGWALALLMVFLLPLPLAILTTFVEPSARRRKLLGILIIFLIFGTFALILCGALAIYIPHIKLIQSVSGGE